MRKTDSYGKQNESKVRQVSCHAAKPTNKPRGRHQPGVQNKLESQYALHLNELLAAGEIIWWKFESIKLKLGPACFYTPDFLVMLPDGTLELHETKGFMQDDARVKLSTCKEMYPFPIWIIRLVNKQWEIKSA